MEFGDLTELKPASVIPVQNSLQTESELGLFNKTTHTSLTDIAEEIRLPIFAAASLATGTAAMLPGEAGFLGKIGTAAIVAAAVGDIASRASNPHSYESSYARDAATIAMIAGGFLLGAKLGSSLEAPSLMRQSFEQDLASQQGLKKILINDGMNVPGRVLMATEGKLPDGVVKLNTPKALEMESGLGADHTAEVINFSKFLSKAKLGAKEMIDETDISMFDPAKQAEIKERLAAMVKLGHKPEFLVLGKDGTVMLDREALEAAKERAALKDL